jgi:DNA-binding IclR family transcriptional regulator
MTQHDPRTTDHVLEQAAPVASVRRALRVLETLADHPQGVALTELSRRLGYGKGSLSKILDTLERDGFVRRELPGGHFRLSWRLLALAFGHAQRLGVPAVFLPILQSLADETDELVQLAVVEQDQLFFVAKAEGPGQRIRMLPLLGTAAPLHATASGKVWLASLPGARVAAVVRRQGLARLAPGTITARARLAAELEEVRRRGYAIVDEELVAGGRAVAAPIVHLERVAGAVAVSAPVFRMTVEQLRALAPRVTRAARELGAVWPMQVAPRDFGLGNGRGRPSRGGVAMIPR